MSRNEEKGRKRPVKWIAGVLVALVGVPAAAWAAYVMMFGATGSVGTASVDYDITSVLKGSPSTATECNGSMTDSESFTMSVGKMFPGDTCTVQVVLEPQGSQDAKMVLQGVEFVSNESFVTAVASSSPTKCGMSFDSTKGTMPVTLTVRAKDTAKMGVSYPADAQAGIKLVPESQYNASECLMFASDGSTTTG